MPSASVVSVTVVTGTGAGGGFVLSPWPLLFTNQHTVKWQSTQHLMQTGQQIQPKGAIAVSEVVYYKNPAPASATVLSASTGSIPWLGPPVGGGRLFQVHFGFVGCLAAKEGGAVALLAVAEADKAQIA